MREQFIEKLIEEFVRIKNDDVEEEELVEMIRDIAKFTREENNFETNQEVIGFKYLFQGYVMKGQAETNFNTN